MKNVTVKECCDCASYLGKHHDRCVYCKSPRLRKVLIPDTDKLPDGHWNQLEENATPNDLI